MEMESNRIKNLSWHIICFDSIGCHNDLLGKGLPWRGLFPPMTRMK